VPRLKALQGEMDLSEALCRFFFTCLILIMLGLSFLPESKYGFLMVEDGLVENGTVLLCFLGVYFCLKLFALRNKVLLRKDYFLIVVSLLFLFVALEEVSWGQRILGVRPVDSGTELNYQREFNLHNVKHMDIFIYMGGFSFVVLTTGVFPVLTYVSKRIKEYFIHLGIPLMPKILCLSMWLGFIILVLIPQLRYSPDNLLQTRFKSMHGIQELREFYFCFILSTYIFIDYFYLLKHKTMYDFTKHPHSHAG